MKNLIYIFLLLFISFIIIFFYMNTNNTKSENIKTDFKEENLKEAYFAWWCFWCLEWIFEAQDWVKEAISWYIWWDKETATYEIVSTGKTNHREWIKVVYDNTKISYKQLVQIFWIQIDPTDKWWQFNDRWFQYTTAIYFQNDLEKEIATKSKLELEESKKFDKEIATKIEVFKTFFQAEEYHQDYYKKSSAKYKLYSYWSWRETYKENTWSDFQFNEDESRYLDYSEERLKKATEDFIVLFFHADWCPTCKAFEEKVFTEFIPENILILKVDFDDNLELKKKYNILTQTSFVIVDNKWNLKKRWIWARWIDDIIKQTADITKTAKVYTKEELKEMLTPLQYKVTQEWWTKPPFDNEYWDNHEEWIYVDAIDWTPLFSSTDKFDSWTWWPSFTKTIDENVVSEETDKSFFMERTEVKTWDSHLWHVFEDWPKDKWWLRYCINSAALKFIPKDELKWSEYEKYLELF